MNTLSNKLLQTPSFIAWLVELPQFSYFNMWLNSTMENVYV